MWVCACGCVVVGAQIKIIIIIKNQKIKMKNNQKESKNKKCCECIQTDVPYTHLFCARREGLKDRMTHVHARSDCVLTEEGRLTD